MKPQTVHCVSVDTRLRFLLSFARINRPSLSSTQYFWTVSRRWQAAHLSSEQLLAGCGLRAGHLARAVCGRPCDWRV